MTTASRCISEKLSAESARIRQVQFSLSPQHPFHSISTHTIFPSKTHQIHPLQTSLPVHQRAPVALVPPQRWVSRPVGHGLQHDGCNMFHIWFIYVTWVILTLQDRKLSRYCTCFLRKKKTALVFLLSFLRLSVKEWVRHCQLVGGLSHVRLRKHDQTNRIRTAGYLYLWVCLNLGILFQFSWLPCGNLT